MHTGNLLACLLLVHVAAATAAERTVYRSVDASGTVSFSDRPPPDAVAETLRVDASDPPPSPEVAERRAAMSRVADELAAARRARETGASPPAEGSAPGPVQQQPAGTPATERDWLPLYYPYAPGRPPVRPPWTRPYPPPAEPAPIPRPNPDSLSPRGLQERLRQAR